MSQQLHTGADDELDRDLDRDLDREFASEEALALLDGVRRTALALLAQTGGDGTRPGTVVVRAGAVSVELTWPAPIPVPAPATPVATPAPAAGNGAVAESGDAELVAVCAPVVGVFYRRPEPGAEPFAAEGDVLAAGAQVGIVEAMKLMIPVRLEEPGRLVRVLKDDGAPVEYGERLLLLAPVTGGG